MSVFHNNILGGAAGSGGAASFQIDRSLRFNDGDSAYLSRTLSSTGNRKTWTWSGWIKRSTLDGTQVIWEATDSSGTTNRATNRFSSSTFIGSDSSTGLSYATTQVFRDVSAWYHFVISMDTTQATNTNRFKLYINGSQVTSFSSITYPTQNADTLFCSSSYFNYIGGTQPAFTQYFDGYMAEVNFVDGQALAPTAFGEYDADTGVWNPIRYTGTHGTNGFHLDFSDNTNTTTIAEDSSGNNNDWTANNISVTAGADNDSLIDTPTNYTASSGNNGGNYCTLNSLDQSPSTGILSDGNLNYAYAGTALYAGVRGTIGVSSGKWYYECKINAINSGFNTKIGIATQGFSYLAASNIAILGDETRYYANDGRKTVSTGTRTVSLYGASYTTGDVIGVAFDLDAGTITFYKNGTSQGQAFSGLSGTYHPAVVTLAGGNLSVNFGQREFAYTPPANHLPLCTQNLPDPTIADGSTAMDVVLYDGNGSTSRDITGLGFASAPDLVWIKNRSTTSDHVLTDSVRGATKELRTNLNSAEVTRTTGLTAFNSDGFRIANNGSYNSNGQSYVAWSWDGGTSTVTNTDGTHSAQVRANSSTGFSISTHSRTTAASISTWGHGLGAAPEFAILKPYNGAYNWIVWHKSIGYRKRLFLNSTSAGNTYGFDVWSSDSTTLGIYGTIIAGGGTALDCVTYAWAPIEGYSRFGSYEANGNADGPFVFTGFTPKLIMTKDIDSTSNWNVYDTSRDTYNAADAKLSWNLSSAESTLAAVDFLSNGFKIRTNNADMNENTRTFIYCAWAENPFKTARAR